MTRILERAFLKESALCFLLPKHFGAGNPAYSDCKEWQVIRKSRVAANSPIGEVMSAGITNMNH
jgi:hypothetical protein